MLTYESKPLNALLYFPIRVIGLLLNDVVFAPNLPCRGKHAGKINDTVTNSRIARLKVEEFPPEGKVTKMDSEKSVSEFLYLYRGVDSASCRPIGIVNESDFFRSQEQLLHSGTSA